VLPHKFKGNLIVDLFTVMTVHQDHVWWLCCVLSTLGGRQAGRRETIKLID